MSFFFFLIKKLVSSLGQCTVILTLMDQRCHCAAPMRTAGKLTVEQLCDSLTNRALKAAESMLQFPFLQLKKPPIPTLCSVMELHEQNLSVLRSELNIWVGTCPPSTTVLCDSGHTAPSLKIDKGKIPKSCSVWMLVQACQASMVDVFHKLHSFLVSIN